MRPSPSISLRRITIVASTLALIATAGLGSSISLAGARPAAAGSRDTVIRHDVLSSITGRQAVRLSVRNPGSAMTLSIGLPIRNEGALNRFLATEGATHGAMTHSQFDSRFGATATQVRQVVTWARAFGLEPTYVSHDGLTINVAGTTSHVEAAFHTTIANYREGSRYFYANTQNPVVPTRLGIQTVLGLNSVPDAHRIALAQRSAVPQCPGFSKGADCYVPQQLRAAYDVSQHGGSGAGQSVGFTLWGAPEVQSDFNLFSSGTGDPKITICAVTTGNTSPAACAHGANTIQFVEFDPNAANKDTSGLGETAMDIEYSHGIAPGIHMKYFLGGDGSDADLVAALSAAEQDKSLHLVSSSWGGAPPTNSQWVTATTEIFKAADAVGTTFLFSTGDQANDSGCQNGLPTLCVQPEYPAASPYVLAVGGTDVQMNKNFTAWSSEDAWDNWQHVDQGSSKGKLVYSVEGGGSGCTTYFSRPAFQQNFQNLAANASCSGRAIPDVSAIADPNNSGVAVVDSAGGKQSVIIEGGTSLATPLWAGMMADTLNFEAGKGITPFWKREFLTPELYSLGRTPLYETYFHDVVCGYNGSPADKGWDQATGLGSPDWYALTQGIAGRTTANTGSAPAGCHLATTPIKTAELDLGIPQSLWPKGSGSPRGGVQTETWLDKTSFFSQFKSHTYAAAGAVGNLAEEATVPIGSDTTNPFGIWLGTVYGSSIQADRVVKNTVAEGKAKYNLKFVDCSNGYSVEFPLVIPNSQDVLRRIARCSSSHSKTARGIPGKPCTGSMPWTTPWARCCSRRRRPRNRPIRTPFSPTPSSWPAGAAWSCITPPPTAIPVRYRPRLARPFGPRA